MSTTLFEAPQYDPGLARRRQKLLITIALAIAILVALGWRYRHWKQERIVGNFFHALQQHDWERAYGIWMADAEWKQHPERYPKYPYNEFYQDWGPGGEWGLINSYHVDGSEVPRGGGSGVVVVVTVNGRAEQAALWVENADNTLTFSPYPVTH
jgi:hypothetical protein